jgi:hypothetical protein
MARLNILPDERFRPMRPVLEDRLREVGESLTPENFADLCQGMIARELEKGFRDAGADSGLVWLLDETRENLVPCFGTGFAARELVLKFKHPLREGIVSLVMMNEQPFIENEVYKDPKHSTLVDEKLQQQTYAMIVVPFYFLRQCRGVISCVQMHTPGADELQKPPGFRTEHLTTLQRTASVLTDLIDYRLLRQTIQW